MSSDLLLIESKLETVDVTSLVKYTKMIQDIAGLQKIAAPQYLRDFIMAIDATNVMLTRATKIDIDIDAALKKAEAIAFLDNATSFLKDKNIKETDNSRKRYVDLDSDVIKARELKAKSTAMVTFLKNKMHIFRHAHDAVKKIGYADNSSTNWEGF